jgi:hypothetical protein
LGLRIQQEKAKHGKTEEEYLFHGYLRRNG